MGLAPEFAATFWTGLFQKIFERLFSGVSDYRRDAYQPVRASSQTSIRLPVRHRLT